MQKSRYRRPLTSAVACVVLAGCQSYEPRPLEPETHRRLWLDRSPSSERVTAFASGLEESSEFGVEYDPSDGVGLAEGEVIALVFNPALRMARLRAGVARATAEHAGLWDDPSLSIDVLRITESVSNPWVVTPGLAFTIPLSGRLEVARSGADASWQAERVRIAEEEWRIRHEVRQSWLRWSSFVLKVRETRALIASMRALVDSTRRLVEAGEMPRTEAALFAIERSQRQQELRRLEGEAEMEQQRLRMLLGLSPDAPLELLPTLEEFPHEADLSASGTPRSLRLDRLRHAYEAAERALHREILKQYPDLTIGPLYESDEGQSRVGFLGAIPLPFFNANRQAIAEAHAERELARAAFETEMERLEGARALASLHAGSLRAQYDEFVADVVPMVDQQVEDARRLLELGEGGGRVLLESLVRAHETKLRVIDLRRAVALASAELAFLFGPAHRAPLVGPTSASTPGTNPPNGTVSGDADQ